MEHDSDTQEEVRKRDKKGGGLFPWLSRSGSPTIPTGIDWSSPMSALRSFWTMLAYAPQGTLLRFALGAAVAVHGLILGASIMSKNQSDDARGEVEFLSRVQARDAAASALGGRTPMDALITGGKVLLGGGPSAADASAGGEGADEEGADEEGGGDAEGAQDAEAAGAAGDDANASASADPEGALKAAMEAANAGGGAGKPRLGALSTQFGGSGSSAKLDAWSGNGGNKGDGGAGGKSARGKSQVRTNSGHMAKNPARSHGALQQLGFANAQSRRGLGSGSKQAAYEAASNAFEGQTGGGGGGAPIGGTGAGSGGSDTAATPGSLKGNSDNDKNISGNEYCTTGRYLVDGECKLIKTSNQTPWQDAVGRAMGSLIAMGIAFFTALMLWKVVLPWAVATHPHAVPFIKAGIIIAVTAGIAAMMHAFVVANQIESKWGQTTQKESIIDQGLQRSIKGQGIYEGPSQREDIRKLRNRSGSDRDFGFNQ